MTNQLCKKALCVANRDYQHISSPVNLMFDLELIATENRLTPFETI